MLFALTFYEKQLIDLSLALLVLDGLDCCLNLFCNQKSGQPTANKEKNDEHCILVFLLGIMLFTSLK